MVRRSHIVMSLILWCLTATMPYAQQSCPDVDLQNLERPIVVGTKFSPPFVMGSKTAPDGLSIDLWRLIADCFRLGQDDYRYVEYGTIEELVDAATVGDVDLAISAIPITVADERIVDFSFPYFEASLGTIVPDRNRSANFKLLLERILDSNILAIVFGLLCFMVAVAVGYWWVERRSGNEFFSGGPFSGLYRALIWAALLVFQGEGDPFELKSRLGQLLVLLLMFVGVTIISSFTAIITSSLTLQALEPEVRTIADLENRTVAVINQGDAAQWAADAGITVRSLHDLSQAQRNFDEDKIEVVIHEREVLRYLINRKSLSGVKFAPLTMAPQDYAIVLPPNSPLREAINLTILTIINTPAWAVTQQKYFGTR
ncbi:transporter substrate-binding domain-containing protein [Yoonia sp.]|uniref:transporter substrate-binding domain-containing protein n=1 Tax=Yoonia sp. TaxID=2212373 RepID=UPI0025F5A785|nr:transporter substrate-binding domain-containing protein [Yoonia sp.]